MLKNEDRITVDDCDVRATTDNMSLVRVDELYLRLREYENVTADISLDRLAEICAAEKEGRCVTLPCKAGDTVYVLVDLQENGKYTRVKPDTIEQIYAGTDGVWMLALERIWHDQPMSEVGINIFLSRESAEAALKASEGTDK